MNTRQRRRLGARRGAWLAAAGLLTLVPVASADQPMVTRHVLTPGISPDAGPIGIAAGPDGSIWFTEFDATRIGRVSPQGVLSTYAPQVPGVAPYDIGVGPDGGLWYTATGRGDSGSDILVGHVSPDGVVTSYPGTHPGSGRGLTAGPDGNIWIAAGPRIGRIDVQGTLTWFPVGLGRADAFDIASGPDGNLWFTDTAGRIGRITPQGVVSEFSAGISPRSVPARIAAGPDGNLWFTEYRGNRIGRITPAGVVREFPLPAGRPGPLDITPGPDGALWFTEPHFNRIGRITTDGVISEIPTGMSPASNRENEYPPGLAPPGGPGHITPGSDGALWFTGYDSNSIGRLDPASGRITEYPAAARIGGVRLLGGGRVRVEVRCPANAAGACTGRVLLQDQARGVESNARFGVSAPLALDPGRTVTVQVRLWAAERRVLRRSGELRLAVSMGGAARAVTLRSGYSNRPSRPTDLGPRAVIGGDGTATLAWVRPNDIIQVASRGPGRRFGRPVDVATGRGPLLGRASDGTITLVWSVGSDEASREAGVRVATRRPGRAFGPPRWISRTSGPAPAEGPKLAISPDGSATIAWQESQRGSDVVRAATRLRGGQFGAARTLSPPGHATSIQAAAAPNGATTVVWSHTRGNGDASVIQVATRGPRGAFGAPITLGPGSEPDVALAAHGRETVVWQGSRGTHGERVIMAATRSPGGRFEAPVRLSAGDKGGGSPTLAAAPGLGDTVVWTQSGRTRDIIWIATRRPRRGWGPPATIASRGRVESPEIAATPDGTTVVAWTATSSSGSSAVMAAIRPPGGRFGTPVSLATGAGAHLAVSARGTIAVVWSRGGSRRSVVQMASRSPNAGFGPRVTVSDPLPTPRVVGSPRPGDVVRCDVGKSLPAEVKWFRVDFDTGLASLRGHTPRYRVSRLDIAWSLVCAVRTSRLGGGRYSYSSPTIVRP